MSYFNSIENLQRKIEDEIGDQFYQDPSSDIDLNEHDWSINKLGQIWSDVPLTISSNQKNSQHVIGKGLGAKFGRPIRAQAGSQIRKGDPNPRVYLFTYLPILNLLPIFTTEYIFYLFF